MTNIPVIDEIIRLADNLYRLGWDERNGGNISMILDEEELKDYVDVNKVIRTIDLDFDMSAMKGKYFIVTGSGCYFKNVSLFPEENLGIVRVNKEGNGLELIWGYTKGARPTSEFPTHFLSHVERLKADKNHKIVIHTHATNLIAMTFVHSLDSREFTRTLWKMCTECAVVFPDGVEVIPWMLCGNIEIGEATKERLKDCRLAVWAHHGILGTGTSIDEAFGLIETAEKAAEVYLKIAHLPRKQDITDAELKVLTDAFGVTPREGYLDI